MSEIRSILKQQIAVIRGEIAALQEELAALVDELSTADAGENPLFSDPDSDGAYSLIPMTNVEHEWLASGDPIKVFYAKWSNNFKCNNIINPLGDSLPDDIDQLYRDAHTKYFYYSIFGLPYYAPVDERPGAYFFVAGNHDAVEARKLLESMWADPAAQERKLYSLAVRRWDAVNREYDRAKGKGTVDEFKKKYPYFPVEDS